MGSQVHATPCSHSKELSIPPDLNPCLNPLFSLLCLAMKIQEILSRCRKPGRYIGQEKNSYQKPWDDVEVTAACLFPDLYEIGMSHMGLQILYDIINKKSWALADRAYCPDTDLEEMLRVDGMPLFGLETRLPLSVFDCLLITLPYELCYSNIFTILDLSGIPVWQKDRGLDPYPLVIGGGSCCLNPEPVADLFDAIVIGDGEEVVVEILELVRAHKKGTMSYHGLLNALSLIPGVYVPSFYRPYYDDKGRFSGIAPIQGKVERVKRRIIPELKPTYQPTRPLLPNVQVVHDRLGIEIARGCTRGCRYCQASTIYRPVRERKPDEILSLVEESLKATGWEEISLLSLSTGDYSAIGPLITLLMDRYVERHVSVSLPSLRVGTLTPDIMEQIKRVRKTGFTLAPEAGSERLRQVINKGITEEDLLQTCEQISAKGWNSVKLYFMIGLPTETEDDVLAITALARKVLAAISNGSRGGRKVARVTVSVGTFVPKPQTPFQWEAQLSIEESRRRLNVIRSNLRGKRFLVKWHDPVQSFLEGVFSRGDRRLSYVIHRAWQLGARLDAWTDNLRAELYFQAARELNLDMEDYLKEISLDASLPWDHIDPGVKKAFIRLERKRAFRREYTPDCRKNECQGCGVCDFERIKPILAEASELRDEKSKGKAGQGRAPRPFFCHISFSKLFDARFLGHLDMVRMFLRAIRRADLPVLYSQGFHPMPKVSFSQPVSLGMESLREEAVLTLGYRLPSEDVMDRLNKELPLGIRICSCEISREKYKIVPASLQGHLILLRGLAIHQGQEIITSFEDAPRFFVDVKKKDKKITVDLKDRVSCLLCLKTEQIEDSRHVTWAKRAISEVSTMENIFLRLDLNQERPPYLNPALVVGHIFNIHGADLDLLRILKV